MIKSKDGLTVQEINDKAVKTCETNIAAFAKYFLPQYHPLPFAPFHKELFNVMFMPNGNYVIVAPRNHAKSTLFLLDIPIWAVCYKKYRNILLVSASMDFTVQWLKKIKAEFELEGGVLTECFGNMIGQSWTNFELKFSNGCTIYAKGRGQQTRGPHYDLVIADDLEDNELVRSPVQMEYFRDWFDRELYGTLEPDAKFINTGTIISQGCHLRDLVEKPNYKSFYYQAYIDGVEKEGNELWKARWTHNKLQTIKSNNPYAFALEYQNNPLSDGSLRFSLEWIQWYSTSPDRLNITMTIDPAVSTKTRADKTAILVMGIDPIGNMYVLDYVNAQIDTSALVNEVFRLNEIWKPRKIGLETVIFQKMLKTYLEEEARRRGIYLPIEGLDTETSKSKSVRIMALIPYFVSGKVFLKRSQLALVDQIKSFPDASSDDLLDALAYQLQIMWKPAMEKQIVRMSAEEIQKWFNKQQVDILFGGNKEKGKVSNTGFRSNFIVGK